MSLAYLEAYVIMKWPRNYLISKFVAQIGTKEKESLAFLSTKSSARLDITNFLTVECGCNYPLAGRITNFHAEIRNNIWRFKILDVPHVSWNQCVLS